MLDQFTSSSTFPLLRSSPTERVVPKGLLIQDLLENNDDDAMNILLERGV